MNYIMPFIYPPSSFWMTTTMTMYCVFLFLEGKDTQSLLQYCWKSLLLCLTCVLPPSCCYNWFHHLCWIYFYVFSFFMFGVEFCLWVAEMRLRLRCGFPGGLELDTHTRSYYFQFFNAFLSLTINLWKGLPGRIISVQLISLDCMRENLVSSGSLCY